MKILAFMKYGDLAASTRQRLMLYEPYLAAAGFTVEYQPLLKNDHIRRLALGRRAAIGATAWAYLTRLWLLVTRRNHDVVWVHYELFPYLPGWAERLAGFSGKPVVVDYDDATFETYAAGPNGMVRRVLGRKLAPLLRGAAACLCGNAYLRDYALQYQPKSIVLPTVVDTDAYVPADRPAGSRVTVGWIGSPSTWVLVRPYLGLLADLSRDLGIEVRVVGAGVVAQADRFPNLKLIDWTRESEVAEIQQMDIGIMPVWDGPFQRGKCGYKLIQYMACGLPVVASPIGVNSEIVRDGENGYLATSVDEWRDALTRLIVDPELRQRLGRAGRRTVQEHYSLSVHAPRLVDTIRSVVASR
jgi:glycosyltransferase involved in cell wall biosynthesis